MIALLQRVRSAHVNVRDDTIAAIDQGILILLGVERGDDEAKADRLVERVTGYRIFEDEYGKMNLNVCQIGGDVLVVPQFTLVADTRKGMRPGFSQAAAPGEGEHLFHYFVRQVRARNLECPTGQFGADMQVHLINDGPVTFSLQV